MYTGVVVDILSIALMARLIVDMIRTDSMGFTVGDIVILVINAVILWYLFSAKVKEFFLDK